MTCWSSWTWATAASYTIFVSQFYFEARLGWVLSHFYRWGGDNDGGNSTNTLPTLLFLFAFPSQFIKIFICKRHKNTEDLFTIAFWRTISSENVQPAKIYMIHIYVRCCCVMYVLWWLKSFTCLLISLCLFGVTTINIISAFCALEKIQSFGDSDTGSTDSRFCIEGSVYVTFTLTFTKRILIQTHRIHTVLVTKYLKVNAPFSAIWFFYECFGSIETTDNGKYSHTVTNKFNAKVWLLLPA